MPLAIAASERWFELAEGAARLQAGRWLMHMYNDVRDVNNDLAAELGARKVDKSTLYAESDVVSISTDLNESSRNMIDAAALEQMRPYALLVCCARGGIIDEPALADALRNGRLRPCLAWQVYYPWRSPSWNRRGLIS